MGLFAQTTMCLLIIEPDRSFFLFFFFFVCGCVNIVVYVFKFLIVLLLYSKSLLVGQVTE